MDGWRVAHAYLVSPSPVFASDLLAGFSALCSVVRTSGQH